MDSKPLCAVWVVTYNQKDFIAQTIDCIVAQKTNFPFKIYIGDDCSTDGTREICIRYKNVYPDLIELIFNSTNLMRQNSANVFGACMQSGANFIALCEGDDYWVDEFKLQKQVNFLENNDQYIICFTRGFVQNGFAQTETLNSEYTEGVELSVYDFIKANTQLTASAVFRNNTGFFLPPWFGDLPFGDWALYLLLMHTYNKKAFCLPDPTVVYRIHGSGNHGNMHSSNIKLIAAYQMHISFYKAIEKKLLGKTYKEAINNAISEKISIITDLCSKEKKILKGIKINIGHILKDLPFKRFLKNIFFLQKQYIKSLIRRA